MGEIENCAGADENEVELPSEELCNNAEEAKHISNIETAKRGQTKKLVKKRATAVTNEENDGATKEDDFETIIKGDDDMASHYVEAFVSDSQDRDEGEKVINAGQEREPSAPVNIDGEEIEELGDDVNSEDLQAVNETTPDLPTQKDTSTKIPRKKKLHSKDKDHCGKENPEKKKKKEFKLVSKKLNEGSSSKKDKKEKKDKKHESKALQAGTWVQCDSRTCMKWRHLKDVHDPSSLPEKWTCSMISGQTCQSPEDPWDESVHSEEFVFTKFTEGSLVWARMPGYPWWPGMVEIDPDFMTYFECTGERKNVATGYHVSFLDEKVSRAWLQLRSLKPFNGESKMGSPVIKGHNYYKVVQKAADIAKEAMGMSLQARLQKFGFAKRFKGKLGCNFVSNGDTGASTSGLKRNKKKRSKPANLASDGASDKSADDLLRETLGMERKEVEYYIENAEEIIRGAENVLEEYLSSQSQKSQKSDDSDYEEEEPVKKKHKVSSKSAVEKQKTKEIIPEKSFDRENIENNSKGKAPKKGTKGIKKSKPKAETEKAETEMVPKLNKEEEAGNKNSIGETENKEQKEESNEKAKTDTKEEQIEPDKVTTDKTKSQISASEQKKKADNKAKPKKKKVAKDTGVNNKEENKSEKKLEVLGNQDQNADKKKPSVPTFSSKKKAPQFGVPAKKRKTEAKELPSKTDSINKENEASKEKSEAPHDDDGKKENMNQESPKKESGKAPMTFDPDVFTLDTSATQEPDNKLSEMKDDKDNEATKEKSEGSNSNTGKSESEVVGEECTFQNVSSSTAEKGKDAEQENENDKKEGKPTEGDIGQEVESDEHTKDGTGDMKEKTADDEDNSDFDFDE